MVEGIRFIEKMVKNPVDKNEVSRELIDLRAAFTKSIVARIDLPAGTVLQEEHLAVKKPGTGIPAGRLPELIGRRLKRQVFKDELISEDGLD